MCEYVNGNKCKITSEICPFVYWCIKKQEYKPLKSMTERCGVKMKLEVPKGYCRVREERKGFLYVDIGDSTYKIQNPFNDIPVFVKATKTKTGWKLRK